MLRVEIAKDVTDPRFTQLFAYSFPENEKIPLRNLRRTFGKGGILRMFYDADRFVGFCYTFDADGIVFLVYLAVRPELRSMGYGSDILEYMANETKYDSMFLVLEQESQGTPAERKERHRRKEFYRRNGWKDTGCKLLSDGYYFDSMYLDRYIPEEYLISTIKYYEDVHTGVR